MNAIIIEDEKLSAEHLTTLLKKVDDSINIIATFDSVKKSVEEFSKGLKADLLFVDIHLADGLSFDIFSKIAIETPVIFTTAFNEYAIQAFKINSVDYLLKPIGIEDLRAAVEKYKKLRGNNQSVILENIANAYKSINKQYKNRFMVKIGDNISSVKTEEILHFISEDGLVLLVTENGKRYVIDYTLDALETLISPDVFFRINRKVLINISSVQKVGTYFNSRLKINSATLKDEDSVVSRERVNDFKQWLDK
ncbi:MAG: response regulator transcription factor [Bacteroidetes bacterium]|nr:response regulator transcription factor [Bacteroidota bacterium]